MILFKVNFKNNKAITAEAAPAHVRTVEWKENPYTIFSIELYANNNLQALEMAQAKANVLLKVNQ